MLPYACLFVKNGSPYLQGTRIQLERQQTSIGRSGNSLIPDINFDNFLISRKHCCIHYTDNGFVIYDLGSKHGTTVNGKPVNPGKSYILADGDRISLAKDMAVLQFIQSEELEKTIDFDSTQKLTSCPEILPIMINPDKRELLIAGRQISLANKEWKLLSSLYTSRNKLVSYNAIRQTIWPERILTNGVPDVGIDEINVLIYRLRRKMGQYGGSVKTVRGCGCILEL